MPFAWHLQCQIIIVKLSMEAEYRSLGSQHSIDQKFQSIKLKYTQSQHNLSASPLKVKINLPKQSEYVSKHSELNANIKQYESNYVSPLRVKEKENIPKGQYSTSDSDFRLSQVKNKLKEYHSLPRYSSQRKSMQQQRTLNREGVAKKSQVLNGQQQNQEDVVVVKEKNEIVPEVIPEESSESMPEAVSDVVSSPLKRSTKYKYESPIKRYHYLSNKNVPEQEKQPSAPLEKHSYKSSASLLSTPVRVALPTQKHKYKPSAELISMPKRASIINSEQVPAQKMTYTPSRKENQIKEQQKERAKAQTVQKQKNRKAIQNIQALLQNIKNTINKSTPYH